MTDLFDKHRPLAERLATAGDAGIGTLNERIISPTRSIINGKETILAGTNNYMGITFEKECVEAGKRALDEAGTGTTGSRIANGSYAMHEELERELAKFLNRKHCIVFSTGYQANLGMIAGLAGPKDTVFLDADSHSSIYDGCTLSGAQLVRFRHNNATDLDKRLTRMGDQGGGRLVVLEGIYSMVGDRAPLADFVEVKKKHGFQLLVDEATRIRAHVENEQASILVLNDQYYPGWEVWVETSGTWSHRGCWPIDAWMRKRSPHVLDTVEDGLPATE